MPLEVCFAHARAGVCRLVPADLRGAGALRVRAQRDRVSGQHARASDAHRRPAAARGAHAPGRSGDGGARRSERVPGAACARRSSSSCERGAALEAVAARLHLSPSALRSRLRQHGTTYSAMLDRLRRDHAKRALRQSQLSIAEIGHRLGFAHPPAFHRAFRRWFGVTPNAYRDAPSVHIRPRASGCRRTLSRPRRLGVADVKPRGCSSEPRSRDAQLGLGMSLRRLVFGRPLRT